MIMWIEKNQQYLLNNITLIESLLRNYIDRITDSSEKSKKIESSKKDDNNEKEIQFLNTPGGDNATPTPTTIASSASATTNNISSISYNDNDNDDDNDEKISLGKTDDTHYSIQNNTENNSLSDSFTFDN